MLAVEPSQSDPQGISAVYEGSCADNEASGPERGRSRSTTQGARPETEAPRRRKGRSRPDTEVHAAVYGGACAVTERWSLEREARSAVA